MANMKRILFVTYSYPNAHKSASVLCTHRVIKCVQDSGLYDVHVLCYQFDNEEQEMLLDGINIHRVRPTRWLRYLDGLQMSRKHESLRHIMTIIQKLFAMWCYPKMLPVSYERLKKASQLLHNKVSFDIVISEHYCVESLLCGCSLMNKYGVKHIAILWDPIKGQTVTHYLPKSFTDNRIEKIENFAINNSSLIISTGTMKEYYRNIEDGAFGKRKFLGFPGIIAPEKDADVNVSQYIREGYINIVYSGQLSSVYRNPIPVVDLFNNCTYASKINLIFFAMGDVKERLDSFSFKGNLSNNGYIPINELHTIYRHADFLLNISHTNANMVPSKLFEYMSYGKPIISAYITEGDAAEKVLTHYPESLVLNLNQSIIENSNKLESFLEAKHNYVPFESVQEIYKDNTPDAYLELINNSV